MFSCCDPMADALQNQQVLAKEAVAMGDVEVEKKKLCEMICIKSFCSVFSKIRIGKFKKVFLTLIRIFLDLIP